MTTLEQPVLSFNWIILQVPQSQIESVLGEAGDYDGHSVWKYINDSGELFVITREREDRDEFAVIGHSKMKDLNAGRDIMTMINRELGKPAMSFYVELKGRNLIYQNKN